MTDALRPPVGVLIVDDHRLFAESLARLLTGEPDLRVLGVAHEVGRIAPGFKANFVVADDQVQVSETWIDGAKA